DFQSAISPSCTRQTHTSRLATRRRSAAGWVGPALSIAWRERSGERPLPFPGGLTGFLSLIRWIRWEKVQGEGFLSSNSKSLLRRVSFGCGLATLCCIAKLHSQTLQNQTPDLRFLPY